MSEEGQVIPVASIHQGLPATLIEVAADLKQTQEELVSTILYSRGVDAYPMFVAEGRYESLQFVPGHVWGREPKKGSPGPRFRSDVMIIDKAVDQRGLDNQRIFSGESGIMLADLFSYAGFEGFSKFFVTTLLKTRVPDSALAYKPQWSKDQIHFLMQEIFLTRPKFMLLMGADVTKAVVGKNVKVSRMENLIHDLTFEAAGQEPVKVKVCVTMRPEALTYSTDDYKRKKMIQQLAKFRSVIEGKRQRDPGKRPPGHIDVDNEQDMVDAFVRVKSDSAEYSQNLICVDCEWEGDHPQSHGAYLRSIQVSGKYGQAITIALTHPGGAPRFKVMRRVIRNGKRYTDKRSLTTEGALPVVIRHLKELLKDRRICGHQVKADLEWLEYYGLDIFEQNLQVPDNPEDCKTQGPFCTLSAAHAYDEQAELGLDDQVSVHLPHIPNYSAALDAHIDEYCKRVGLAKSALEGYGNLDDEPLYLYAGWDVDAGIQLALFYLRKLSRDNQGNNCWRAYHITIGAMYGANEITKVGMLFNREQANKITIAFMLKRAELLEKIRTMVRWPDLNMDSTDQIRELLFGVKYNGKPGFTRLRPPGALTLATFPLLSTGKYQKNWDELVDSGEDHKYNVSCNRTVLGLLLLDAEKLLVRRRVRKGKWVVRDCNAMKLLSLIRDYRLVAQQLKGPLRPPTDPPPARDDWDPDEPYYAKGIPGSVCADERVRTTILQTMETGRWSSVHPPLMNLSNAADAQLKKVFGDSYPGSVKLMLEADPDYFLVAPDIGGAELRMTAVQSQDEKFIDATERLSLPEEHPDHLDIHGGIAVSAFNLPCAPTKSAMEAAGKGDLRTGAKTVIFGKFYGQSIQAAVIAVRQRGVPATFDQMLAISDTFDATYPGVLEYFEGAMDRVFKGYTTTWAGRYRRFAKSNEHSKIKAMQRESLNAGIQGGVADYISKCIPLAIKYRNENKMDARLVLQKHDELMFLVHKKDVRKFCMEGVPHFMRDGLCFWAADFEGVRVPGTPDYRFSYDVDVMRTWGAKLKGDDLKALGIERP